MCITAVFTKYLVFCDAESKYTLHYIIWIHFRGNITYEFKNCNLKWPGISRYKIDVKVFRRMS